MANNTTKTKRKALASTIVSSIEARLGEAGETTKKMKKSIEKSADKLAKKLAKLMDKDASKKVKAEKQAQKKEQKAKKDTKKSGKKLVEAEKNTQRAASAQPTATQTPGNVSAEAVAPTLLTGSKPQRSQPAPRTKANGSSAPQKPATRPTPEPVADADTAG